MGSIAIAPPAVRCAPDLECAGASSPPRILVAGITAIDVTTAVPIAAADPGTGVGAYTYSPGNIVDVPGWNLQFVIPAAAYATTYSSTITISMIAGP